MRVSAEYVAHAQVARENPEVCDFDVGQLLTPEEEAGGEEFPLVEPQSFLLPPCSYTYPGKLKETGISINMTENGSLSCVSYVKTDGF